MLNLRDLNAFVEAAQTRSFSEAARRLYLSQPAVSLQIRNLEKQLGADLFLRTGCGIQLSPEGRTLLPLAQKLLRDAKCVEDTMAGLSDRLAGELQVACSTTVGKYILPRLVAGFRKRYPDVRVAINVMSRRAAVEAVLDGRVETAVVSALVNHEDLRYQEFLRARIVLIAPRDHPWATGRTVAPADLLAEPFILRESSAAATELLVEGLARCGQDSELLNVVLTLANDEAIAMSVEAGIGVAFVSRLAAANLLELGRVIEVPVEGMDISRTIYLIRHARQPGSSLHQAFREFALAPENEEIRSLARVA